MTRRVQYLLGAVACALTLTAVLIASTTGPRSSPAPATTGPSPHPAVVTVPANSPQLQQIRTQVVTTASHAGDEVLAPGRIVVDPRRLSRIALPVPGRVHSIAVQLGDVVRAGQPVLVLESPDAEAALAEARQAEAAVRQARAAVTRATADLDRVRDLHAHKAVARKDVEHAEEELVQAQGAQAQAEAAASQTARRVEILGLDSRSHNRMVLRAPITGKVLEVSVTAGEYHTDTSAPVVTIADLTTVLVSSDVPERDIRLIQLGEDVSIELVAYPGQLFQGHVTRISDAVDARTRTLQVQAEIANPKGQLRPEMYGRIRHSHTARAVPVVPIQAVVQESHGPFVFVEQAPGSFLRRRVAPGETEGGQVAILDGVRAGDKVVVDGVMLLQAQKAGDPR